MLDLNPPVLADHLKQALIAQANAKARVALAKQMLAAQAALLVAEAEKLAAQEALHAEQEKAQAELAVREELQSGSGKATDLHIKARVASIVAVQEAERSAVEADYSVRLLKGGVDARLKLLQQAVVDRQLEQDLASAEVEALRAQLSLAIAPM